MSNFINKIFRKLFPSHSESLGETLDQKEDEGLSNNNGESASVTQNKLSFDDATAPLTEDQLSEILMRSNQIEPKQLIVGVARDVGRQRKNNEDSIFALSTIIDSNETSLPVGIFIVADGMGGHKNGEVASELAVRTMSYHLVKTLLHILFFY